MTLGPPRLNLAAGISEKSKSPTVKSSFCYYQPMNISRIFYCLTAIFLLSTHPEYLVASC